MIPAPVRAAAVGALRFLNRTRHGRVGRKFTATIGHSLLPAGSVAVDAVVGNGFRMTLHLDDELDYSVYFDAFEHTTCEALHAILRPGDTFADVGANIGFFSLMAARIVGRDGRVVAFEPNPAARQRLVAARQQNGCDGVVEVRAYGLADTARSTLLFVPAKRGAAFASLRPRATLGSCSEETVELHPLDDVWHHSDALRCLKVDVEGAELSVLRGARETLRTWRPHVICEVNEETAASFGYSPLEIVDFVLTEIGGYRVHALTGRDIRLDVGGGPSSLRVPRIENWWFAPR